MREAIESVYYNRLQGEWESLQRWAWLYLHSTILVATMLVGFMIAHGAYLLALLLVPFPLLYLYKRYEKAKAYTIHTAS